MTENERFRLDFPDRTISAMNALIIEDEKLVALELTASIAEVDPNINIVGTVGSVKTALRWFAENAEPGRNLCRHSTRRRDQFYHLR